MLFFQFLDIQEQTMKGNTSCLAFVLQLFSTMDIFCQSFWMKDYNKQLNSWHCSWRYNTNNLTCKVCSKSFTKQKGFPGNLEPAITELNVSDTSINRCWTVFVIKTQTLTINHTENKANVFQLWLPYLQAFTSPLSHAVWLHSYT